MSQVFRLLVACALLARAGVVAPAHAAVMTGDTGGSQPHNEIQPSLGLVPLIRVGGSTDFIGEIMWWAVDSRAATPPGGYLVADGSLHLIANQSDLFDKIGTTYGGDGARTFALPNLIGKTVIGTGQRPGGTNFTLGQTIGSESLALTTDQIPSHTHGPNTLPTGGGQSHSNFQPSIALNYAVGVDGLFPSIIDPTGPEPIAGDLATEGEIKIFAGPTLPSSYLPADGTDLPISTYSAVFALLGTTYGGDGRDDFGLPDLGGTAAMHEGSGPGLTPRTLGEFAGSEDASLTTSQIASHTHTTPGDDTPATGGGATHNNMQPSLTVHYIIALQGVFPTDTSDPSGGPYLGEVRLFAGNFAPRGWAFLDGQFLSTAANPALFNLLGTTYGGDGDATFALPDLRGRIPVGASATVPGLTDPFAGLVAAPNLGQKFGTEEHQLVTSELPAHSHIIIPTPAALPAGLLTIVALASRRPRRSEAG